MKHEFESLGQLGAGELWRCACCGALLVKRADGVELATVPTRAGVEHPDRLSWWCAPTHLPKKDASNSDRAWDHVGPCDCAPCLAASA